MRRAVLTTCLMLTLCGCTGNSNGSEAAGAAATGSGQKTENAVPKPSTEDEDAVRRGLEALKRGDGATAVRALEKAVRSFIKADGRELKGVGIFENSRTVNH